MTKYLEFDTPAAKQREDLKSAFGLDNHGLVYLDRVFWNLPEPALYEEAVFRGETFGSHRSSPLKTSGRTRYRTRHLRSPFTGVTSSMVCLSTTPTPPP